MSNENEWQQRVQWLVDAGYKQRQIAKKCGIDEGTVSKLLKGDVKQPCGMAAVTLHRWSNRYRPAA